MDKEKKLLKAIGDIDEKFIDEARPEKVVRIAPKRSLKPLGVMAAAAVIILGLGIFMRMNVPKEAALMAPAPETSAASSHEDMDGSSQKNSDTGLTEAKMPALSDASSQDSAGGNTSQIEAAPMEEAAEAEEKSAADNSVQPRVMMENPWKDSDSLADAIKDAGFDITIPEAVKNYNPAVYRSIKGDMLEIIYCDSDSQEGLRVRKAHGTDDISGDYNVYTTEKDMTVGDVKVHIKENDDVVFVATWTRGDFSFAIVMEENQHFTEEEITGLVEEIV